MKLAVAITANNRPDYLREVLDSWRAVDGIDEVPFLFSVEPSAHEDEVLGMCLRFGADQQYVYVHINDEKQGPHRNPFIALTGVFDLYEPDFAILGEDDSVVATDVLDFFRTMASNFRDNPSIFTVNACNLRCDACCSRVNHVRRGAFCSTVWGLWDYRWAEVRESWGMDYSDHGGWDMKFNEAVKGRRDCLIPCVSRAQHIGQYGSSHVNLDFELSQSRCFEQHPVRQEAWSIMRSYS